MVFFYIFDNDSLAVFLNHSYLIVSDSGRQKKNLLPLPVIDYSWISQVNDDYFDRADYCNQGQWLSCSVKHSCADLCVAYSHVPYGAFATL